MFHKFSDYTPLPLTSSATPPPCASEAAARGAGAQVRRGDLARPGGGGVKLEIYETKKSKSTLWLAFGKHTRVKNKIKTKPRSVASAAPLQLEKKTYLRHQIGHLTSPT